MFHRLKKHTFLLKNKNPGLLSATYWQGHHAWIILHKGLWLFMLLLHRNSATDLWSLRQPGSHSRDKRLKILGQKYLTALKNSMLAFTELFINSLNCFRRKKYNHVYIYKTIDRNLFTISPSFCTQDVWEPGSHPLANLIDCKQGFEPRSSHFFSLVHCTFK